MSEGWRHLYDRALQFAAIVPFWPPQGWPGWWTSSSQFWTPFVSPPPVAWLAAPLNSLPESAAESLWLALLGAALVAAAWLAAPPGWPARLRYTSLLVLTWAAMLAVVTGNVVVLVALGLVVAARLLEGGREVLAGVVLGLAVVKPQVMFLVPVCLLLTGRLRATAAFAVMATVLAGVAALTLGSHGLQSYRDLLRFVAGFGQEQGLSVTGLVGPLAARVVTGVLLSAAACLAAVLARRRGAVAVVAIGTLGSLLVSPYLNLEDYVLLLPAVMLVLRSGSAMPERVVAVGLALSATAATQGYVLPSVLLVAVLVALVAGREVLAAPSLRTTP